MFRSFCWVAFWLYLVQPSKQFLFPKNGYGPIGNKLCSSTSCPITFVRTKTSILPSTTENNNPTKVLEEVEALFQLRSSEEIGVDEEDSDETLEAWYQYSEIMHQVIYSRRITRKNSDVLLLGSIKKILFKRDATVSTDIPFFDQLQNGNTKQEKLSKESYREQMQMQRDRFMKHTGLTVKEYKILARALTYTVDLCAKYKDPDALEFVWRKIKEAGIIQREVSLCTCVYILSTASLNETNEKSRLLCYNQLLKEVGGVLYTCFKPDEGIISVRVKVMASLGDVQGAEQLIGAFLEENSSASRLRTLSPLLHLYGDIGDIYSMVKIYRKMKTLPGVKFDTETYAKFLASIAQNGYFDDESKPLQCPSELGLSSTHGAELFDELVYEVADDILEFDDHSVRILMKGFESYIEKEKLPIDDGIVAVDNSPASEDELVVSRVAVDPETGVCPRTGATLRLLVLTDEQKNHVQDTLISMADTEFMLYRTKHGTKNATSDDITVEASTQLTKFIDWLNEREGEPFTAVLDGPNIGYYGSSYFQYSPVESAVKELEKMNERPLVIMPEKYLADKVFTGQTQKTRVFTETELQIRDSLIEDGKIYAVPSQCLDDYYWMIASVVNQKRSSNCMEKTVSAGDTITNDRFPGLRPMLVSNDQMRDHRLALLEPRLFRRWKNSYIVNFRVSRGINTGTTEGDTDIRLYPADVFSEEIQGNTAPEKDGGLCGTVWHFPVSDWNDHERLCICIPKSK